MVLFFKIVLAIITSLHFHINFTIVMLDSYISLELIAIWTILFLLVCECEDFFRIVHFQWFAYDVSRYRSLYIDSNWFYLGFTKLVGWVHLCFQQIWDILSIISSNSALPHPFESLIVCILVLLILTHHFT